MIHEELMKKAQEFVQVLVESMRDEMLEAVSDCIETSIAELSQSVEQAAAPKKATPRDNLYTQKEVEKMFGLDRSTVNRWVRNGKLHLVKVSRGNYYKKDEVDSLIKY